MTVVDQSSPRTASRRPGPSASARSFSPYGRDRLTVALYHRIADPTDPGLIDDPGNISATPAAFERQIRLMQRWFSLISIDDLVAYAVDGAPLPPRPALITFDDGYLDNYTAAFPVLRSARVPAVVFLMTAYMGSGRRPWWDELHQLFRRTERSAADLPLIGHRALGTSRERSLALREFSARLKALPQEMLPDAVADLAAVLDVERATDLPRLFMDWDEIRTMAAHGVSFQPHTHTHPILSRVGEEQVQAEVKESVRHIRDQLGTRPIAFAYPNGRPEDFDEATRSALREADLPIAFTTTPGPVRCPAVRVAPLDIPRVSISNRDDVARFAVKMSGLPALAGRLRRR